jgi:hypothetical protein
MDWQQRFDEKFNLYNYDEEYESYTTVGETVKAFIQSELEAESKKWENAYEGRKIVHKKELEALKEDILRNITPGSWNVDEEVIEAFEKRGIKP